MSDVSQPGPDGPAPEDQRERPGPMVERCEIETPMGTLKGQIVKRHGRMVTVQVDGQFGHACFHERYVRGR